ncbi:MULTISPECIES: hypothetical protein [Streptomyces]|uniref:Membrane-bound hydrophilic protein n=1 Tax=Streptomyces dengpaensis TaxID=2049881 RepID=A0ABM6SPP7_9ACTN|nr:MULTISPECIES: hypothetical protein [Streptomyces]AVH56409.1 hypothetical protein C4B68_12205 [Streptomyces dengpaensis]PIB10564.1 hypothetical protein B1C81_08890 [Streptomyces sp. HG99]
MPADEVTHGTEVDESRVRTGPRHAAPRKPLFTRFHVPAGKAIALAAMPTAVLMGMGLTPTLAQAKDQPTSKSLTADEYQACVEAIEGAEDGKDASDTASPSASASADASEPADQPTPAPSASSGASSSPDSGSDDEATPAPSASSSSSAPSAGTSNQPSGGGTSSGTSATPAPSASASDGNVLEDIGNAIGDVLTGGESSASPSPTPSASASASPSESASKDTPDSGSGTVEDTADKVTETVEDTVKDATDTASEAASDAQDAVTKAAEEAATASPSPSASSTVDPSDCPVATDEKGGIDNPVTLPDDPWYLDASSLLLKGADYQGIVKVKTANGTVKDVLKYVISDGTDIGDLHQTVKDKQSGKTYHVQAASGSTSTIRDGETVMYTESISGNLLGLVPVTFSPENPPPLNIPLIYFTKVKVVQAGQFGGTLTVPGLHSYQTD